jgi:small subunit ribosomal protein S20
LIEEATLANHKSAEKRARQATKRQARNVAAKRSAKSLEKKFLVSLSEKKAEVGELFRQVNSKLMSLVSKGVLKKQTAARKISRLAKKMKAPAN